MGLGGYDDDDDEEEEEDGDWSFEIHFQAYLERIFYNGKVGGTPLTEGFLIVQLIVMGRSQLTIVVIC